MKPETARRRLAAALGLYLIWLGALIAMALTTAAPPPPSPTAATADQ